MAERNVCGAHPELVRSIDQRFDRIEEALDKLPERIASVARASLEQRLELHLLRAHPGVGLGQIVTAPMPRPAADDEQARTWGKALGVAILVVGTAIAAWLGAPGAKAPEPRQVVAAPAQPATTANP